MKVIELKDWGLEHVAVSDRPDPTCGPDDVLIEMHAAALNFRDFVFVRGGYGREGGPLPMVLLSDGAGRVIDVGKNVTRAAIGDLVCPTIMPGWIDGPIKDEYRRQSRGGSIDGVMAGKMALPESAIVKAPDFYTPAEAATLPCAALTAWNALAGIKSGDLVVTQGTGGVSLFALQFARAMGATVVITSSSEEKLHRASTLGAQLGINYDSHPDWAKELLRMTGRRGADLVIELGGAESLPQSIRAVRTGGTIALIGVLSGANAELELGRVVTRGLRLQAVTMGSRDDFEAMVTFIEQHKIKPVIDALRFSFAETRAAIATMSQGRHFGKLVIEF
jgi:NADPH:quinone reductase-like Zn-dependent oxidoreductase